MTIVLPRGLRPIHSGECCRHVILLLFLMTSMPAQINAQTHAAMPEAMAAPVRTAEAPAPALVGGWHPADPDAATKAARFALPHLKEKRPRLRRILSAEQQICVGIHSIELLHFFVFVGPQHACEWDLEIGGLMPSIIKGLLEGQDTVLAVNHVKLGR